MGSSSRLSHLKKAAPMKGAALLAGMHRSKVFFSRKLKQFQLGFRQLFLDMSSFLCTKLFLDMLTQIHNFKILHMYLQQTFLSSFRTVILRRHLYQTAMPVELYNCGSEFLPQLQKTVHYIANSYSRQLDKSVMPFQDSAWEFLYHNLLLCHRNQVVLKLEQTFQKYG